MEARRLSALSSTKVMVCVYGEPTFTVKAVASKNKNASSGKIVVHANNCSKDIPAVIFSPEDAKELLEIAERAMTASY